MTSNKTATVETSYGALAFQVELSYRAAIAATNLLQAKWITIFLARRFGSRDSFVDSVTGHTITVAVWDGKEYFLSSKD